MAYSCALLLSVLLYLASTTNLFSQYYDPSTVSDRNLRAKAQAMLNNHWLHSRGLLPANEAVSKQDLKGFYEDNHDNLSPGNNYQLVRIIRSMSHPDAKVTYIEEALSYYKSKKCGGSSANNSKSDAIEREARAPDDSFCGEIPKMIKNALDSVIFLAADPAIYRGGENLQAVYALDIISALLRRNEYFRDRHPRVVLKAQTNNYFAWQRISKHWNHVADKMSNPEAFKIKQGLPKIRSDIESLLPEGRSLDQYLDKHPSPIRS